MARKPHDNDAELKAAAERRKALLLQRKLRLGELVQACGADGALDFDQIGGALRAALEHCAQDPVQAEILRRKGQEYFRRDRPGNGSADKPGARHGSGNAPGQERRTGPDRAPASGRHPAAPAGSQLPLDPQG